MTDTLTQTTLPHWDMTTVFPALDSKEFADSFTALGESISVLEKAFDDAGIRRAESPDVDARTVAAFDEVVTRSNEIEERMRVIRAYVYSFITTEAGNDTAQARFSELQNLTVDMEKLGKRFVAWLGSLDAGALIERSAVARDHEFRIHKIREEAVHLMSELEEDLAATLGPSGQSAWSKLHGNVTSRVMADVAMPDGRVERLPMAAVRGLAHDPDPQVRQAGYRAEMATWPTVEVPLAAALNSIKGWQNALNARRGYAHSLEPALRANNVDAETLLAMQTACVEAFPDFRRYLRAKARLLGKDMLAWWDLSAPVGDGGRHWDWDETASFIVDQFGTYSDKLAGLAARAFLERWIDAEPREGKRDGGFCMGVRDDESRILVNFTHDFSSVSTVAHELGHAYHNINMVDRTPLQRRTPMALAETASTFCETIVTNAMLDKASESERLGILEASLAHSVAIVAEIHSRFLFEKSVFERRQQRELAPRELCAALTEAQQEVFGDAVDATQLHPYQWALKPHYYGFAYYNWPYTFGQLFGTGLYAEFRKDAHAFRAGYDDLLASTGMLDAADLAARFGMNVRSVDFWRSSLDVVRANIDAFERLAG
jgi:pepF/M3 family oligoendopeptidase